MFMRIARGVGGLCVAAGVGCSDVEAIKQENSALRFTMKNLAGEQVNLATYEGTVVMIVNVASRCRFTPQYGQLQALYEKYRDQGFVILGFPSNQFLGQEPGSSEEIEQFCRLHYGVTFPMFEKVKVRGDQACELYRLLSRIESQPVGPGKVSWNFEKFLLDRQGMVIGRFSPSTRSDSPEIVQRIEAELAAANRH